MVVGPAFSTWWVDPPFSSLLAMARTAEAATVLNDHVPVVPSIVWRFSEDLQRWASWLKQSGAKATCVDLGTLRTRSALSWALDAIVELGELLGRSVPTLLVNGPSTPDRLHDVFAAWPGRVVPMSQHPWQLAQHGKLLNDELSASPAPGIHVNELAVLNADTFDRFVRRIAARSPVQQTA
jgi:hypothetical protein